MGNYQNSQSEQGQTKRPKIKTTTINTSVVL